VPVDSAVLQQGTRSVSSTAWPRGIAAGADIAETLYRTRNLEAAAR